MMLVAIANQNHRAKKHRKIWTESREKGKNIIHDEEVNENAEGMNIPATPERTAPPEIGSFSALNRK